MMIACVGLGAGEECNVWNKFQNWYGALSPRRRTGYNVLVAVIVATLPCYCIGVYALVEGLPPVLRPRALATPTPIDPTPTTHLPTNTPLPDTPTATVTATETVEPTPTQMPTLTLTPTALPTETATEAPTETPTPTATESPTETVTPTATETATITATPEPTATSTRTTSGTIQPLPQVLVEPDSGPPNTTVTVSGELFAPQTEYLVYWDSPDEPIGIALTDAMGQFSVVFDVPAGAEEGRHRVMVELDGVVVAREPFTVTAP
jgi:hypothetical protein